VVDHSEAMLIDAHTHLDHYDEGLMPEVLAQIEQLRMLTIGVATDPLSWTRTTVLAQSTPWILPTFGIHPWKAADYVDQWDTLHGLIEQSPMIGEIGLDFHWVEDRSTDDAQRNVLRFFLEAAREQQKIVNLHTKGAEPEILAMLEAYAVERAIIHWYSGPLDIAQKLADRGAFFTVGVEINYSDAIKTMASQLPIGQLLTETDGPSGLEWLGGGIGMPQHVRDVVGTLARLRGLEQLEMQHIVWENTKRLFSNDVRLKPWMKFLNSHV
jgi:TatD DNase family protein